MRGTEHRPAGSMGALVAQAAEALRGTDRALVTVYHGQLDGTGHTFGATSDAWRYHLGHVDKLAEQLAAALPAGTPLYVTADHGMVDVGPDDRIDVDSLPALRDRSARHGAQPFHPDGTASHLQSHALRWPGQQPAVPVSRAGQFRPQLGMPVIHSIIRGDARVCGTSSTESWDLPTG